MPFQHFSDIRPEKKNPCGSDLQACKLLWEWYQSPLGKGLAEEESNHLRAVLPTLFGYYLLQMGKPFEPAYLDASLIRQKLIMKLCATDCDDNGFVSTPTSLSIASDSVDVVILPHILELQVNPHQVLREVDRVLIPEGHVVILGFNPWGMWGVRNWVSCWQNTPPWCANFLSPFRVKDWLRLLNFELQIAATFFHKPPINTNYVKNNLNRWNSVSSKLWPAFGGSYVLVAKKQVITLTQIPKIWRPMKKLVKTRLAETNTSHLK